MSKKLKIVDLFCGCGGFGLGAEFAGFTSVAAVDLDETLQSAYKLNFPKTKVMQEDLANMDEKGWGSVLQKHDVDGVIGGPPCQGYSRMGKRAKDDPRNELLYHYFRHVRILNPKFFLMENVEGLLDKVYEESFVRTLQYIGDKYTVLKPVVVDARDYGAATKRRRVIIFGYKPEFFRDISYESIFSTMGIDNNVTVQDAISDLPEPIVSLKEKHDFGWAIYKKNKVLSNYALKMRKFPPDNLCSDEARKKLSNCSVSGFFSTVHTDKVRQRYAELKPDSIDPISRAKRLAWNGVCPTLRAGTGNDKGSYQAVRPIHPTVPRVITVREAARLQGFPDWFCFHPTKWHSFRMIGNSVSPLVSEKIMKNIKSCINFKEVW